MVVLGDGVGCEDDCSNEGEGEDKGEDGDENESGSCNCMEKRPKYCYYSFVPR